MKITLAISPDPSLSLATDAQPQLSVASEYIGLPPYSGSTTVVPSGVRQVLATAGTRLEQDITIEPVPGGWGRIGWNGSVITVS